MLPKKLRLTKEGEILRSFRTRFRHFDSRFKIYLSPNKDGRFKLLLVVSKKISKRAHERNRIKRKIQGIFEQLHRDHRLPPSVSCVIQIVSKDVIHMTQAQIKDDIMPKIGDVYKKMNP